MRYKVSGCEEVYWKTFKKGWKIIANYGEWEGGDWMAGSKWKILWKTHCHKFKNMILQIPSISVNSERMVGRASAEEEQALLNTFASLLAPSLQG